MTPLPVVLDANIYISALVFGGKPKRALQLAIRRQVRVAVSDPILEEVRRTLRTKFGWADDRIGEALELITTFAERVAPTVVVQAVEADPDDDRVLECAVTAGAARIVSGDRDLLRLGSYEGIRIVTVADFLDQISGTAPGE